MLLGASSRFWQRCGSSLVLGRSKSSSSDVNRIRRRNRSLALMWHFGNASTAPGLCWAVFYFAFLETRSRATTARRRLCRLFRNFIGSPGGIHFERQSLRVGGRGGRASRRMGSNWRCCQLRLFVWLVLRSRRDRCYKSSYIICIRRNRSLKQLLWRNIVGYE